jgi:homoserine kinase type II
MQIQESTLFTVLTGWPIEPPSTLTPLVGGTNNQVWLVETENGPSYVLRLIAGVADLIHVRYEAALLTMLHDTALPFHLPFPLPTRAGDIPNLIELDNAELAIATLTPFLPGHLPARNAATSTQVGVALAQLDAALASIPPASLPTNAGSAHFLYGDLSHCHPLVPDPITAVEHLLEPAQARPISSILRQTQQDWETLTAQDLPQQMLHRDCGPGNVLVDEERVTAILDFEFAGIDRRVFDLCVALSWWPVRLMGTGQEWELIDSLGRAYTAYVPLTEEELLTLPASLRMRDTTSLIYRIGRYIAGQESEKTIQERARHSLWREEWLLGNQETLVQHALAWAKDQGRG